MIQIIKSIEDAEYKSWLKTNDFPFHVSKIIIKIQLKDLVVRTTLADKLHTKLDK